MKLTSRFQFILAGLLLAALAGCKADTITEPRQTPAPPTPPGLGIVVSLTTSQTSVAAGSTTPVTVTVRATRSDGALLTGQLTLTTSLGGFGSVGGPQTTVVDIVNGVGTAFFFPSATAGVASIRVEDNGTILASTNITIGEVSFVLSHLDPNSGSSAGGDTVDIVGSGFEGPATVTFGGSPAQVLSVSPTRIRVRTPPFIGDPGPNGTAVAVTVVIRAGASNQATATLANAFFYTRGSGGGFIPSIASVTPVNGPNEGGTVVTINGSGFQSPVQVFFEVATGGVEAQVQSVSSSRIVVISPSATGFGSVLRDQQVNIRVRNLGTGLEAVAANAFRYGVVIRITSMGPGVGPFTGGTIVTLFGEGFDEPVALSLGGVAQIVLSVTGTEIVFRTVGITPTTCPASGIITVTGVSVTNIETGATATADLGFNFLVPVPIITGVSPNSGSVGSTVTISGQGFATNVQVLFGGPSGSTAQVLSNTPTSIQARVPNPPPDFTFNTEPCDANGDGIAGGQRNVPTPITIVVKNLDNAGCTATLSNAFTLSPTNTTCTGEEPVTPVAANFTVACTAGTRNCNFTDTSTGAPTSWSWNFGDPGSGAANTSNAQNPAHTFSADGNFTVMLTASKAGATPSNAQRIVSCVAGSCS